MMRPDLIGSTCAARLTYLGLNTRDRQAPGARGCIKKCGEEARDIGSRHSFVARPTYYLGIPGYPEQTTPYLLLLLLPHCLTDAGTAEDVRQGASAQ